MKDRCGKLAGRWALAFGIVLLGVGGSASAMLLDRGPDMVYDTVLDITWTQQAGDGVERTVADAVSWADSLVLGGFDDWRLPFASVSAGAGPTSSVHSCNGAGGADEVACRDNEMGYMFYYNLDGTSGDNKNGAQTAVGGEQLTGITFVYWSGTTDFSGTWVFNFFNGAQGPVNSSGNHAWAVRPGDVAAVPEPGVLLLLGVGALGIGWSRRSARA